MTMTYMAVQFGDGCGELRGRRRRHLRGRRRTTAKCSVEVLGLRINAEFRREEQPPSAGVAAALASPVPCPAVPRVGGGVPR